MVILKGNIVASMIARKLAEFTSSLSYDRIPSEAIEKAITCFIDFLGVSMRGSQEKSGLIAARVFSAKGGPSSVIGNGKSSPDIAALLNGIFAHNLDLDDGHRIAQMHPGCCVIPAALAVAEYRDASFRDFITAIVAGYEVAIFMGILANPEHRQRGFHTTGTCGTIGAAAAAARILGLNSEDTTNALGLAGTQASGLLESDHSGSMGKHLHAGRAAQSGVISALLAADGFTGAETIFDGDEGFMAAMCGTRDYKEPAIGAFHILNVYMKRYPVCRHLHSTLDSAMEILSGHQFEPAEIEEVTVSTYRVAADHSNYSPKTTEAVRQSLPFSLALLIENRGLGIEDLEMAPLASETAMKIKIKYDDEMEDMQPDKRPSRVEIRLKDGRVYESMRELPLGEPEHPLTREDIIKKFSKLNPHYDTDKIKLIEGARSMRVRELMDELNGYN